MTWPDRREVRDTGIVVRSGIEEIFAERLLDAGIPFDYERENIGGYVPDFWVGDIVVELKGRATDDDIDKGEQFMDTRDETYVIVGDTRITDIPADKHFDFDTELDEAVRWIKYNE